MVKNEQKVGRSWILGWAYQQCDKDGNIIDDTVYTRPDNLFDGDWTFIK